MYDNIDLTLSKKAGSGTSFLESIPNYLSAISTCGSNSFGEYVIGYLGKLKVNITENNVKVKDSSLCKFYLGDNFKTLSKGDTKRAIEKISDGLHLPFEHANVTRIDFAQNFIMQHPEHTYYTYLGEAQYYQRLEQNNGLYYNNSKRQLLFYGKVYEQKHKGQPIPPLYGNRNVLRYELRLRKRLREEFNVPSLEASMLYNEKFYLDLVKRWEQEYSSIQKINSKLGKMTPTGSKKQFIENLALYTILDVGQPQVLSKVKEWQATGEISKKQAYDLRTSVRQLTQKPNDEVGNELINELDRKIKEAARYS